MTFRERFRLLLGLLTSLLIHIFVLAPTLVATLRTPPPQHSTHARFEDNDLSWREPPEVVPLGLERGPASTLTWVGHETYEEHLAERAEFEQAAFTEKSATPAAVTAAPEETATPPAPPTEAEVEPTPEPPAAAPAEVAPTPPAEPTTEVLLRPQDLVPLGHVLARIGRPVETIEAPPAPEPSPTPPAAAPKTPTKPVTAEGDDETEEVGEVSDLEADPTSIVEVALEDIRLGRPVARAGLELKPRRPKFTTLTTLTAAPCNPIVEIDFARTGVPLRARLVEGSCDSRIDHAIKNSLYRWRAKGEALTKLADGETHTVRLQIVLSSRR